MSINVHSIGAPGRVARGAACVLSQAGDSCETKEWERRRRARLAQVREQSKDIAKTVRERASRERLRQLGRIEKGKKEDYVGRQERLVERLEKLHASNLLTIGSGHDDAAQLTETEKLAGKPRDNSKPRGRLAAKVLHKSQEDDFRKKKDILDKKLTARTIANARSRLKLSEAASKDLTQENGSGDTVTDNALDITINPNVNDSVSAHHRVGPDAGHNDPKADAAQEPLLTSEAAPAKKDMETQWSVNGLTEWIPSTVFSDETAPGTVKSKVNAPQSARTLTNIGQRKDLFAVSDDMPTSLCGDTHRVTSAEAQNKPSLSIVSEFLRTRDDRLPKPKSGFHKVSSEELHGIRDTLLRTRPIGGTESICRVVDDQAIPGPTWQAVSNCGFCTFDNLQPHIGASKINRNISNVKANRVRSRSVVNEFPRRDLNPWNRSSSPPRPPSNFPKPPQNSPVKGTTSKVSKSGASSSSVNPLAKKRSVMQYDHVTKSTKDLPFESDKFVSKITDQDLDAYSLAMKESEATLTNASKREKEYVEQHRTKVAVCRQKVAQEYRDTMAFLQTLSKDDKDKPIGSAYMDDYHQHKRRETHQKKLQNEFELIQRESKLKAAESVTVGRGANIEPKRYHKHSSHVERKPTSPANLSSDNEDITHVARNSLTDAQALLHQIRQTIPHRHDSLDRLPQSNAIKKSTRFVNSVKFDFMPNSYNYTQSVKHTPPTRERQSDLQREKDSIINANEREREVSINVIDYEEQISAAENTSDTLVSECSSDYDLIIQRHNKPKSKSSKEDIRKFIVYKVKDTSDEEAASKKKNKIKSKLMNQAKHKEKNRSDKELIGDVLVEQSRVVKSKSPEKSDNRQELLDGVPEAARSCVNQLIREYNPVCFEFWNTDADKHKTWWEEPGEVLTFQNKCQDQEAQTWSQAQQGPQWDIDSVSPKRKIDIGSGQEKSECNCSHKQSYSTGTQPTVSTTTSAATFRTATSDKSSCTTTGGGGYVKVLDEMGAEAGKFYIGAREYPQDDAYEVIIQLKRRIGSPKNQDKSVQSSPISPKLVEEIKQLASQISSEMKQEKVACPTDQIAGQLMKIAVQMCQNTKPTVKATPMPGAVCEFSSSSSTVYMSPPERILPKFLQDDYLMSTDVLHQAPGINETSKEQIMTYISAKRMMSRRQPDTEMCIRESRGTNTRRKKCRVKSHRRPASGSSTSSPSRKSPNMVCCCRECGRLVSETPRVNMCFHAGTCKKLATSSKQECTQAKIVKDKKQVYNTLVDNCESKPDGYKCKVYKSNLSPLVQKYINELLEMSKDGLKAVEVATLQCSTVSTPGSSVINMPSNIDPKSSHEGKMRKKLKDIITANIYNMQKECANAKRGSRTYQKPMIHSSSNKVPPNTETSSDSPIIEKGLGDNLKLQQNIRRAKSKALHRHKIKSLNISKNIVKYFKTIDSKELKKSVYFVQSPRCTSSDTGQRYSDIQRRPKLNKFHYKTRSRSSPATTRGAHIPNHSPIEEMESDKGQKTKKVNDKIVLPKKTISAPATNIKPKTAIKPQAPTKSTITKEKKPNVRTETMIHSEDEKPNIKPCTQKSMIKHSPPVRDENCRKSNNINIPITSSTQTQLQVSSDDNVMQIAEEKLQNMEKIADLTEKCTKRLSNLAKVLDEVRKNKSNMYNQISSADTSFSEHSSGKNSCSLRSKSETDQILTLHKKDILCTTPKKGQDFEKSKDIPTMHVVSDYLESEAQNKQENENFKYDDRTSSSQQDLAFVPILGDIPKPIHSSVSGSNIESYRMTMPTMPDKGHKISSQIEESIKTKSKPPPALVRANIRSEEALIPHELSTVLEVDSPMSTRNASLRIKNKSPISINVIISEEVDQPAECAAEDSQPITTTPMMLQPESSQQDTKGNEDLTSYRDTNLKPVNLANKFVVDAPEPTTEAQLRNAYINNLQSSLLSLSVHQNETSMNHSEKTKLKMIDMNKFNDIMLKPFISIEEYARQYDIALLDEGSNLEDVSNKKPNDEDMSSLNSEGTLPDIIAELLKRNVISEPFNFAGDPHAESNALSSDSNSVFAMSKPKRHKKKVSINTKPLNTDDNVDTSGSLSFASKADLERAFEELGMGWASSTLKKTKETLALSSSTSTMSSMEHPKYRKFKKSERDNRLQQLPAMASDTSDTQSVHVHAASTSDSLRNSSEDKENKSSKHSVELQTSYQFNKPTTVKDFLANSLAGKITFQSKKSPWKEEEEHYSSLYSTKLSMDTSNAQIIEKRASSELTLKHNDSKQNTRHRTSTPVQLFKSLTFNSSTSSYNHSNNGLFGNGDDLSSVKGTSASNKNSSTDKDELTVPNYSLKLKKSNSSSYSDS